MTAAPTTFDFAKPLNAAGIGSSAWLGRVLVACEYSGAVRDAFAKRGWDAWSCDILPSETPGQHIQGLVELVIGGHYPETCFDLLVAHPPCTYLCNSGVRWLYNKDGSRNSERWAKMKEAAYFFKWMLSRPIPHIAVENPIMHKHALEIISVKPSQVIQPWQHGHGETKATCLWLKNLPLLRPSNVVAGREQRIWKLPPSADRWKERSRTFSGIAEAMANQWTLATRPNGRDEPRSPEKPTKSGA